MMTCSYCAKQHMPVNNGDGMSPCCNAPLVDENMIYAAIDMLAVLKIVRQKIGEIQDKPNMPMLSLDHALNYMDALAANAIAKAEGRD
jgi:hypothetical protein